MSTLPVQSGDADDRRLRRARTWALTGFGIAAAIALTMSTPSAATLPDIVVRSFETCFPDAQSPLATDVRNDLLEAVNDGIDPDLLGEFLTRGHAAGLSQREIAGEISRAQRLATRELPAELTIDRILQGLAKGVPYARIEPVAAEFESRLVHAGELLDSTARTETRTSEETREGRRQMVGDVAYALGAGAPDADVMKSMQLALDQDLSLVSARAPVLALGGMVGAGVPADQSLRVVEEAWASGFRDSALEELGSQLSRLQRDDPNGTSRVIDELLQDLRAHGAPDRVLERLEEIVGPSGAAAPGVGPNADPGQIRGPGGPPDDPGRQNPGGPRHDPPGPGPGGH